MPNASAPVLPAVRFLATCLFLVAAQACPAVDIQFRSFSSTAAIGPPADAYAAKLAELSATVLGAGQAVRFTRLAPTPAIPAQFGGKILPAVAAGGPLAGGAGFDAAYVSGSDLNPAWGFIYNSGVPVGPGFDEFLGFLYGAGGEAAAPTGLDLLQDILDQTKANVVALPIVGSPEQGSGYFMRPIGPARSAPGIGLAGFCQESWTLRYLPPAQQVLENACDRLVADGAIPRRNIRFIAAVAGKTVLEAVLAGDIQGFEFATPYDDTEFFAKPGGNPGTAGLRFLHFPGWHQPFLVTYLIVNKQVWQKLSGAQQALVASTARDHVAASYAENLRRQGPSLARILAANAGVAGQEMELVRWPEADLALLRQASERFLAARADDAALSAADRANYGRILERFRQYVGQNGAYWTVRAVPPAQRFGAGN